jgi:alpha-D-xyloside xylohydrolase
VRWAGEVEPEVTGDYTFQTFSNSGIKLWVDDRLVIDHWRQGWLPWKDVAKVRLEAKRRTKIRLEWSKDQNMETVQLLWKTPASSPAPQTTSLWSEVGDGIDYYFVYGPELGQRRRRLPPHHRASAHDPALGPGAVAKPAALRDGQSRASDVVDGFRSRGIPFDTIVQDWFYWKEDSWGSHEFDPIRFPDPGGMGPQDPRQARPSDDLGMGQVLSGHEELRGHALARIPVRAQPGEGLRDWVGKGGYPYTFYDAFNPEAGKLFWSQMEGSLLRKKVDAWWLDAPEPDRAAYPDAGWTAHLHAPDGARLGVAHAQCVFAGEQQDRLRRAASRGARATRVHPDPLGVRGKPALRRGSLVGRHHFDLDGTAAADPSRARVVDLGHSVLDHGHRGLRRARRASRLSTPPLRTRRNGAS